MGAPCSVSRRMRTRTSRRVGDGALASSFDYADEFEFGLDLILDAIARQLADAR